MNNYLSDYDIDILFNYAMKLFENIGDKDSKLVSNIIFKICSTHGHADSMAMLAERLVESDFQKAIELYEQSVSLGSSLAAYNLYIAFAENGDELNAKRWFKKAREMRFPFAMEEEFMKYK